MPQLENGEEKLILFRGGRSFWKPFSNAFYDYIAICVVLVPIYLNFFKLDVDAHHDGIILAQAIGVADGLTPNKDIFAYYGPGSAWLHGLFLVITDHKLINLRFLNILLLICTSLLLLYCLKKYLTRGVSLLLVLSWGLAPSSNLPWPSVISTFLILISATIILSEKGKFISERHIYAASFFLVLATYVRIHAIVISIFVVLFTFATRNLRCFAFSWARAHFIFHSLVWVAMIMAGSASGFINDSLLYPRSVAVGGHFKLSYFVGMLFYPFFYLFLVILYKLYLINSTHKYFRELLLSGKFLVSCLIALIVIKYFDEARLPPVTYRNPKIILIDSSGMFVSATGYFLTVFLICLTVKTFWPFQKDVLTRASSGIVLQQKLVMLAFSLGAITQLYPLYDRFHLWYVTPILMIAAAVHLEKNNPVFSLNRSAVCSILTLLIVVQISNFVVLASHPRIEFKSSILRGLYGSSSKVNQIDSTLHFVTSNYDGTPMAFICDNGLYSVSNGHYLSNSPAFINWGPKYPDLFESTKKIFICHSTEDDISKYLAGGWSIGSREVYQEISKSDRIRYNFILTRQ